MTTKIERLERQIFDAELMLKYKRAVMARHQPGTSWHTRARLEAEGYERRIAELRAELANA